MLNLIYGADWRENRKHLLHMVCEKAQNGQGNQVILVPDQFSHEMERRLLLAGGDTISRFAEILSFSRLAERVFSLQGGVADVPLDNGGRLCAAAAAVEQVRTQLKLYGSCATKPDFLRQLLDTVDECRAFCLTPSELTKAGQASSGLLAQKLEEISLLLQSYEAVCAHGSTDPSTRLMKLLELLKACDYADTRTFCFEGFADFNALELDILSALLEGSGDVTVVLLCDDIHDGQEVFDGVRQTVRQLEQLASKLDVPIGYTRIDEGQRPHALHFLKDGLLSGPVQAYAQEQESVSCFACADEYAEASEAAGRILELVVAGYRYRDISVVCPDMEQYRPILNSVFSRYAIPKYYSGTENILQKPVIRTVLYALDCVTGGMEQESVFAFLKSGIDLLAADACNRLENYVITWGIEANGYRSRWSMNPAGYDKKPNVGKQALLEELNQSRALLCDTLGAFQDRLYAAENTGQQVLALYAFLEKIGLEKRLSELAEQSTAQGMLQTAQEYSQLYGIVISAMEQIYNLLSKTVRSAEDFSRLLRATLSEYHVGTIPALLDGVNVGSVMSLRQNATKVLLILGANDGSFPAGASESGLLSEEERKRLRSLGLQVAPGRQEQLTRELHGIYNVLCGASERVIMSAVQEQEAFLYKRLCRMFPPKPCSEFPLAARFSRTAALEYASQLGAKGQELAACVQDGMDEYEENRRKAAYLPGNLSEQTVGELYGKELYLSASRIDQQAKCRLAYFLNYGLCAKERKKADFDAPIYGTFVHYVMEQVAKQVRQAGGFRAVTAAYVSELAKKTMDEFASNQLGDLADRPERFTYLYERNLREVLQVVQDLFDEMQTTQFVCEGFEVKFGTNGSLDAISIVGSRKNARLEGLVDRVDLFRNGDVTYVRVVDYKTGRKDFDYTDILNGIGLQLLIYLFALEKGGDKLFGGKLAAGGVLYFPARFELKRETAKPTAEDIAAANQKERERKGLVLDDPIVLHAMESGENPYYMPYGYKKNGTAVGSLMTTQQLASLRQYVYSALRDMTDEIACGELYPNPYWRGGVKNACQYCPYQSICHVQSEPVKKRVRKNVRADRFWKEVEANCHG